MKYIISMIVFSFLSMTSYSEVEKKLFTVDANAMIRDEDKDLEKQKVQLIDLESATHFQGKYVTVLRKNTDEVIKIDPSGEEIESLRAATAYHHMTQARLYYESIGFEQKEKLTVRIGIENDWHKKYHFKNISNGKLFNNAHTLNSGKAIKSLGIKEWGKEIWFRNPKEVEITDQEKDILKQSLRETIPKSTILDADLIIFSLLNSVVAQDPLQYVTTTTEGILQNYLTNESVRYIAPEITALFLEDEFYLDSALIPEVIIHEFTHFMMSDHIPTVENVPLTEGLADYFATKVTNNNEIAKNLGDQGALIAHRDSGREVYYHYNYDSFKNVFLGSGTQYVLSLLTLIDQYISRYEEPTYATKKLFELRKHITINSKIEEDLPRALFKVFPKKYKLGILAILNRTGL